ncbi:MAG: fructosamine kinase family protein [Gammaproteobacteria bacterium]|nr:MAG: fructosamine kinase family protein [Gammaproteobacteria bacterium]
MDEVIDKYISNALQINYKTIKTTPITGGCINQCYKIQNKKHKFFVKINQIKFLKMFEKEAFSLQQIKKSNTIKVPEVISHGTDKNNNTSFLILEHIDLKNSGDSIKLGENIAKLHNKKYPKFGFDENNFIGLSSQINIYKKNWIEFYRKNRLLKQLKLLQQKTGTINLQNLYTICDNLSQFFESYQPYPSLLHGDLWSGNYGFDNKGQPIIFDPASYYGDRETDLAMSELFGGFSQEFYASYNRVLPLDDGYKVRKNLYNLYHILNHFNLFGGGYANQANTMMEDLLSQIK